MLATRAAATAFMRGVRLGFQENLYSNNPNSLLYQKSGKMRALGIRFFGREVGLTPKGVEYAVFWPLANSAVYLIFL
ncbi:hypothetical protein K0U07_01195, partial [bacterium]|nr:hypothetical protein [bacterium]